MTRKKFVKQLMALGFSRNAANSIATRVRASGEQYAAYYLWRRPWWRLAHMARKARAAVLNMTKLCPALMTRELQAALVAHHPQPITPENLEGGKVYLVTKQEHDRLHGYSANVSYVDDLDALRYTAMTMDRGGGGND